MPGMGDGHEVDKMISKSPHLVKVEAATWISDCQGSLQMLQFVAGFVAADPSPALRNSSFFRGRSPVGVTAQMSILDF